MSVQKSRPVPHVTKLSMMADLQIFKCCCSMKTQLIWLKFCEAVVTNSLDLDCLLYIILGICVIMDQTACCYVVPAWKIGIYKFYPSFYLFLGSLQM